ncbi:hypothetical protein ACIOOZ_004657, partial [Escherichia coli]
KRYVVSDTGISGEGRRYIVSVQFMVIHIGCSDCCIQCYRRYINQQMVPQIVLIFIFQQVQFFMAAVNSEAQINNHPCNNSNIRQLNNNDFFFTEFHTLPPL